MCAALTFKKLALDADICFLLQKVTNIEASPLGYTYDTVVSPPDPPPRQDSESPYLRVSGISRSSIAGSFVLAVWGETEDKPEPILVGFEPVLSRWHVSGCANCNTHLNVMMFLPLDSNTWGSSHDKINNARFSAVVYTAKGSTVVDEKWGLGTEMGVVEPCFPGE